MMEVKRVSEKRFEDTIEDKMTEGFKVESKSENQAVLIKRNLGSALWHFLIFMLTVWFTFGFGNLLYLVFAYFVRKNVLIIKKNK